MYRRNAEVDSEPGPTWKERLAEHHEKHYDVYCAACVTLIVGIIVASVAILISVADARNQYYKSSRMLFMREKCGQDHPVEEGQAADNMWYVKCMNSNGDVRNVYIETKVP